jgi:retinol dehydrogenase-12
MSSLILVTGANRGLGRAGALALARAGHRLLLTARQLDTLDPVRAELEASAPGCVERCVALDLTSFASVRAGAAQLQGLAIDGLLNNAGVMQQSATRRVTGDGCEETLQVNTLSPFLLTRLLLPGLRRAARARIVNVSSRLHMPGTRGAPVHFDFDDPQLARSYQPDRAYKNSKLALLWWTYQLAERLAGTPVHCLAICPGFVPLTASESVTGWQRFFLRHVLVHAPFATSVADVARAYVEALTDPALAQSNGIFLADHKPVRSSDESYDKDKASRFWMLASRLTGLPETD